MSCYFPVTKDDCRKIIDALIAIVQMSFPDTPFSFMAYGSYLRKWRVGLSDLDGIIYFHESPFSEIATSPALERLRLRMRVLYQEMPFLKASGFLADVRILDRFHGRDGRFVVHDADSFRMFLVPGRYAIVHGNDFVPSLRPMSLYNLDEFDLASGLQCLRKYLFFELPKTGGDISINERKNALKFLRTLPRIVSKILEKPADPIYEGLDLLSRHFPGIDYQPLRDLDTIAQDYDQLENFLTSWHGSGAESFINCWRCHEKTLEALVAAMPAKSQH